ncbi:MAG TPA: SLC13 family permease [Thermoanaerobaculia bacterium]|nr:SLC13 family permease [Thermoanaerobaculia bacterium]
MTAEIAFVLALMLVAVVLFSLERMPVDVVALGLLISLMVAGVIDAQTALQGFGNQAVVAIAALLVIGAALRASGVIDRLGAWTERHASRRPLDARGSGAMGVMVSLVASVSAFLSNTMATATFLPLGIGLARSRGISPSRVLMPLAFASILGGSITLVGTSTNLIVSGILPEHGEPPFRFFELAPVGVPIAVAGIAYLVLIAPRLLPDRAEPGTGEIAVSPEYLTEVEVIAGSPLAGSTVADSRFGRDFDLTLLRVVRGAELVRPGPQDVLREGDRLLVEGRLETLVALETSRRVAIVRKGAQGALAAPGEKLIEVVVLPRSNLIGRTLREIDFRNRYDASVLAINRHSERLVAQLGDLPIGIGDVLVVQGDAPALARFLALPGLLVLSDREARSLERGSSWVAPGVFVGAVLLAATGVLAVSTAMLLGCLVIVATGQLRAREAYEAIDWSLIVLIASMIGYGRAMETSGAASYLAELVAGWSSGLGPVGLLGAFYLLTVALTQPMSNQAAALVVLPIALQVAVEAGIGTRAMAVTVALAASSSFLTPLEPSCLLVYAPGRYRFLDFTRVGAGLTLIALLLTLLLVPKIWPV